jgi:hypothetical protein
MLTSMLTITLFLFDNVLKMPLPRKTCSSTIFTLLSESVYDPIYGNKSVFVLVLKDKNKSSLLLKEDEAQSYRYVSYNLHAAQFYQNLAYQLNIRVFESRNL